MSDAPRAFSGAVRLVLFDLDGTLADTAPDLAYALNRTLEENDRPPLPFDAIRPQVSHGGAALIRLGFRVDQEDTRFKGYYDRLIDTYKANIDRETRLFDGMERVLDHLEARAIPWGVVTNKPSWLTNPLMDRLGLARRAACVVSGDTTANRKPHPEPILFACGQARSDPGEALYVGDAERDIRAGRAAGAVTLTALFGYIGTEDDPASWGADGSVSAPAEILDWLGPRGGR